MYGIVNNLLSLYLCFKNLKCQNCLRGELSLYQPRYRSSWRFSNINGRQTIWKAIIIIKIIFIWYSVLIWRGMVVFTFNLFALIVKVISIILIGTIDFVITLKRQHYITLRKYGMIGSYTLILRNNYAKNVNQNILCKQKIFLNATALCSININCINCKKILVVDGLDSGWLAYFVYSPNPLLNKRYNTTIILSTSTQHKLPKLKKTSKSNILNWAMPIINV